MGAARACELIAAVEDAPSPTRELAATLCWLGDRPARERDRFLLKAVFLEQRDRDEVCREFGVDREYLRVLLHRAKREFKTEYLKRFGGPLPLDAEA